MKKVLMVIFSFLTFLVLTISSSASSTQDSLKEEWKQRRKENFNTLYESSIEAEIAEEDFFKNPYPSKDAALDALLDKYPPLEGGLYSYYKDQVHRIIKSNIGFLHPEIECSSPWGQISMNVLGAMDPNYVLPDLIALVEIRKVPGYGEWCKDFFDHLKKQIRREEVVNTRLLALKNEEQKPKPPKKLKRLQDISNRFSSLHISN